MQWLEITIDTASDTIDGVAEALTAEGFDDLVFEDGSQITQFLEQNRAYWDYVDDAFQKRLSGLSRIKLYLEDTDKIGLERLKSLVSALRENTALGTLQMQMTPLAPTNWEESWKDSYPPQKIGSRLIVVPYWCAQKTDGRIPVILDPGLTFGTGAHPSTQMVMEAMESCVRPETRGIDLGSGSGILSIAALRLGAKSMIGVDIDPKAEDIARSNAARNGFAAPEFTALTGNVLADRGLMERLAQTQYDTVLVNIVADVIISLAPILPRLMGSDSVLICSGILNTRCDEVRGALEGAGLRIRELRAKEEWRCILAERRNQ